MKQILWFRRDLRIIDNEILSSAKGEVLPIFIFDKNILQNLPNNDKRVTFIHKSVYELKENLKKIGLDLALFFDTPTNVFTKLKKQGFDEILTSIDFDSYAKKRDDEIEKIIPLRRFLDSYLINPKDILKSDKTPYKVFTPFYNSLEPLHQSNYIKEFEVSKNINKVDFDYSFFPSLDELGFEKQDLPNFLYKTADELICDFSKKIRNYQENRDFFYLDVGSNLSVHLRFGLISPKMVFNKIKKLQAPKKEIDFFIHKDAKSFLEEQFNIYLYNYLFKDSEIEFNKWNIERLEQIKAIKTTIFETIELISKFENELRAIWLKPKFVRKSRYIISLKTLKKLLEKDVYKEVLNSVIQNLSNMQYYNDLVFSIKDIYKKPLEKIYIDKIEFVNNEFKFSSVKVFSDEKKFNEYLEKNENEKQCNSIIYDRDNTIDGFYASYTKNNIVNTLSIEDMYIDTKYFTEEFTNKLLEAISKNNNIEECIDGTLIKSDNFQALNTILSKYKESINLVYIDPPFNTGADFAYKDKFRDSTWLTLLENRLDYIKKLLHIDGSLYLHLDHNCNYIARQLLEEKFPNTFRREIIWNTSPSPSGFKTKALNFVRQHDTIFYMANSENPTFNKLYRTQEEDKSIGWLDPILENEQLFIEKYVDGELKKEPIGEVSTLAIGDVWNDIYSMMFTQNMTRENWSEQNTQKPENLLRRIIQTSSNKGDTILDFFAGSGTTLVSAHKLKRKWIGVEMGEFIEKITLKRLKTVLVGDIKPKLTQDLNWNGGGFIKYYELESYEDVLSKAHYSLNKETLIDLYQSEKLANDNVINKNSNIKLNIDEIYNDIDIFETISNITGFRIKKIHEEKCIFLDKDKEILIDKNNLNFSDYPFLR